MRVKILLSKLPPRGVGGRQAYSTHIGMKAILLRQFEENRSLSWAEFMELKRLYKSLRRQAACYDRGGVPNVVKAPDHAPCATVTEQTFNLMLPGNRLKKIPKKAAKSLPVIVVPPVEVD